MAIASSLEKRSTWQPRCTNMIKTPKYVHATTNHICVSARKRKKVEIHKSAAWMAPLAQLPADHATLISSKPSRSMDTRSSCVVAR
eukprot:CAMPEP_0176164296 /NCGR_PEP_ID=MMETSP0120_2-20121206/84047_1 /TAXON_ID=160619 /ORGANISM="Kryptoperidinium foliaceum, Strain CCMP 1326" /LENGTH=85 /DNA_ID=CAMNT_0017501827 /DNA_START=574 /DNA_END=827 /DNA_ORIENTATION=+